MLSVAARQSTNLIALKHPPKVVDRHFTRNAVHGNAEWSHRRAISKLVLESIDGPPNDSDPIWTTEINRRALNLLQLLLPMQQAQPSRHRLAYDFAVAHELTKHLMNAYRLLDFHDRDRTLRCEDAIRHIVAGLVDLFRSAGGMVELAMQVRSLSLPARKRRALALLIGEIVLSSLLHGAKRTVPTRLTLSSFREAGLGGSIDVETSVPLSYSFACPGYAMICALSGILEAEMSYGETGTGGTRIKIRIP